MKTKKNTAKVSPLECVARLVLTAMEHTEATHEPTTTFKLSDRDTEFSLTLKRIDGRRVLSKPEALLMARIKKGQQDLDPSEIRIAKRILAKQR